MKLRTFTALLLAAIMLFALTACGSQAADDSSSDQQQEQQDTTTNESNEFRVGMECAYAPNNWQESEATDSNVPVENVAGTYAEGYDVQIAKAIAEGLGVSGQTVGRYLDLLVVRRLTSPSGDGTGLFIKNKPAWGSVYDLARLYDALHNAALQDYTVNPRD